MWESIKKQWQSQVALIIFTVFTLWWISFQFTQFRSNYSIELFGSTYAILAAWGAIWGIAISKKWGFLNSVMGKAILFFSLGLLAQVLGQIAYTIYIYYLHIPIPYPSWGDLWYFVSIPLYILGTYFLANASGVKVSLTSFTKKFQAILIPVVMLGVGYLLFLQGYSFDWSTPLVIFLDFGYPLGQAIYVSLAILTFLLTRGILGGIMHYRVLFIIFALVAQFLSDYVFLYQISRNTWHVGGINEWMYLLSYLLMSLALFQLDSVLQKLRGD